MLQQLSPVLWQHLSGHTQLVKHWPMPDHHRLAVVAAGKLTHLWRSAGAGYKPRHNDCICCALSESNIVTIALVGGGLCGIKPSTPECPLGHPISAGNGMANM